jgi:hypothetical protein
MTGERGKKGLGRRPVLEPGMSIEDFIAYYWMKADLMVFARKLGLRTHGYKPELTTRIERRLRALPARPETAPSASKGPRDSDQALRRDTPVRNYRSDDKTRTFFERQIGPEFHFTYHLNQYRLARKKLTYGDLVDEWLAERDRRRRADYQAPIATHGKWNRFVRDFFADKANRGKSLSDAAAAWRVVKRGRGDHRYQPGTKAQRRARWRSRSLAASPARASVPPVRVTAPS